MTKVFAGEPSNPPGENVIYHGIDGDARRRLLDKLEPKYLPLAFSFLSSGERKDMLEADGIVARLTAPNPNPGENNIKFLVHTLIGFNLNGKIYHGLDSAHLAEVLKYDNFAILKLLANSPALLDAVLKQLELKELATMIDNPTVLGYVKRNISRLAVAEEIDRLEAEPLSNLLLKLDAEHWTEALKLDAVLWAKVLLRLDTGILAHMLETYPKIAEGLGEHLAYVLTELDPKLRAEVLLVLLERPEILNSSGEILACVFNGGTRNKGKESFDGLELGGYKEVLAKLKLEDQAKVLAGRNPRDLAEVLQDDGYKILNDLAKNADKKLLDAVLDGLPVEYLVAMIKEPEVLDYLKRHTSRLAEVRKSIGQAGFQELIEGAELKDFVSGEILEALGEGNSTKLAELLNGSSEAVRKAALSQREVINCLRQDPADFAQAYAGRILKAVPKAGEVEAVPETGEGEAVPKAEGIERGAPVGLEPEALGEVVNDKDNGVLKYLIDHANKGKADSLVKVLAGLRPEARIELLKQPDVRTALEKNPNAYKLFLVGFKSRDGINYDGFSPGDLGPLLKRDEEGNNEILDFFSNQGNESPQYLYNLLTGLDGETATQMLTNPKILDCFRRDLAFSLQKFQFSRGDPSCLSRTIVHFGKDAETMVTNEVVDILKEDPHGLAGVFVLLSPTKRQEVCERLTGQELSAMLASIPKTDDGIGALLETLKHGPNLGKLMASGVEFENLANIFLRLKEIKIETQTEILNRNCNGTEFGKHLRARCSNFKPGRKDHIKISLQNRLAKQLSDAGFP